MVGFLGVGLIIAAGVVSGQFSQFAAVITNRTISPAGNTQIPQIPVNRNQMLLLFGEIIFVIIAAKLAQTSDAANKVLVALFVGLWFVWAMYNSQDLSNWVAKVQPKPGG